jgi:hypothetical protein
MGYYADYGNPIFPVIRIMREGGESLETVQWQIITHHTQAMLDHAKAIEWIMNAIPAPDDHGQTK